MKRNEKGFRELVKLAMKYRVRTNYTAGTAECLVCGFKSEITPGHLDNFAMEAHIEDHVVNEEITAKNVTGG